MKMCILKLLTLILSIITLSCYWQEFKLSNAFIAKFRERNDSYSYKNTKKLKGELKELSIYRISNFNELERKKREGEGQIIIKDWHINLPPCTGGNSGYKKEEDIIMINKGTNRDIKKYFKDLENLEREAPIETFLNDNNGKQGKFRRFFFNYGILKGDLKVFKTKFNKNLLEELKIELSEIKEIEEMKNRLLKKLIYRFPTLGEKLDTLFDCYSDFEL